MGFPSMLDESDKGGQVLGKGGQTGSFCPTLRFPAVSAHRVPLPVSRNLLYVNG